MADESGDGGDGDGDDTFLIGNSLDYKSSTLVRIADAVASLSCEALRADIASFNSFLNFGGDASAVASDIKVLLNGSKFVGIFRSNGVSRIPKIHGSLRSASRSLQSATRLELNSASLGYVEDSLLPLLSSLALSLYRLGEISLARSKLCCDSLHDGLPGFVDSFNSNCPTILNLAESIKSVNEAFPENNYDNSVHLILALADCVGRILCCEAIVSFAVLEFNGLIETEGVPSEGTGEGSAKVDKKKDKRKAVMGKGTTVLIHYIKETLQFAKLEKNTADVQLQKLATDFLTLFSFENGGIDPFVQKVKYIFDSNETGRLPKIPKGTRDFAKKQMAVREKALSIIRKVFKRHGATVLDAPVFELREILTGKDGEDSKLIYDQADQGGELCSLRCDLTVPFARYVAMNSLTSSKRYQVDKVYRRDNPSKGKYPGFYQCAFDIAGDGTVSADFEVIRILTEVLNELNIGDYEIKLNHRKLVDGILDICGVPQEKFRTICCSIDKLDNQSFEQVKKEMVDEKGLDVETADKIGSFVTLRGEPLKLLGELSTEGSMFSENSASSDALKELEKLFDALKSGRCLDKVVLDLSLARGLDYYTGVMYEAVFKGETQVGSIAAGGRYDNLIGKFGTKHVPAIGVRFGIERIFTIMEEKLHKDPNQVVRATETEVLVSIFGDKDISLAAELVSQCWDADLKAEFMVHKRGSKHFDRANESRIPWMVIVGDRERREGIVKLRDMVSNINEDVPITSFVDELVERIHSDRRQGGIHHGHAAFQRHCRDFHLKQLRDEDRHRPENSERSSESSDHESHRNSDHDSSLIDSKARYIPCDMAVAEIYEPFFRKPPALLTIRNEGTKQGDDGDYEVNLQFDFYNPLFETTSSKCCRVSRLSSYSLGLYSRIYAADFGWLLTDIGGYDRLFTNPYTCEMISIPSVYRGFDFMHFSSPPSSRDCIIIGVSALFGSTNISIIQRGEEEWRLYPFVGSLKPSLCNAVFHEGCFYFVGSDFKMGVYDVESNEWNVYRELLILRRHLYRPIGLVGDGEWMILVYEVQSYTLRIARFSTVERRWEDVDGLGNERFLFVSPGSSRLEEVTLTTMGNRIYLPMFYGGSGVFYSFETKKYHSDNHKFCNEKPLGLKCPPYSIWIRPDRKFVKIRKSERIVERNEEDYEEYVIKWLDLLINWADIVDEQAESD